MTPGGCSARPSPDGSAGPAGHASPRQSRGSTSAREVLKHRHGDRLISLIAYSGLRAPEELLALEWRHVGRQTILVEHNEDGEIVVGQKVRARPPRAVDLVAPLRQDLTEWRMASGRPAASSLVFPRADGAPWRRHDYNFRRRLWHPAREAAGVEPLPPYDLRHAFASLHIRAGTSVPELAEMLGHSPQMTLSTYTHVIRELKGTRIAWNHRPLHYEWDEGRYGRLNALANETAFPLVERDRRVGLSQRLTRCLRRVLYRCCTAIVSPCSPIPPEAGSVVRFPEWMCSGRRFAMASPPTTSNTPCETPSSSKRSTRIPLVTWFSAPTEQANSWSWS